MTLQDWTMVRKRRMAFGLVILAAGAALFLPGAMAKDVRACGTETTLRLSAPEASQGSLLLIELKSAKPLAEVQGEWDEKSVPLWREGANEGQRRGLLGVDLEKAPGEYELKVTGQTAGGGKISCNVMVAVRKGQFATEKLQVEKQFVEPSPEQVKRANEERQKLRDIFDRVTPERLWDGPFRIPLDGVTTGSNFGKRRILNGNPGSPGNTVVVNHGLGIYTFYGHLSEIDVKAGDSLETGAVLGKVGATGRVTGPHLHWGLTVERARVNPLLFVKLLGTSPEAPARRKAAKRRTR
jgi:murein DD-endopeptidase MepM/ murein hydrolase activator NlpD